MTPDSTLKLVAASLPVLAVLLSIGEWIAFRVGRAAVDDELGSSSLAQWGRRRTVGYLALVALGLAAFPIAFYTFAVSLVVPPWQIVWTTAGAIAVTGLAGIVTAIVMLFRPVRRPLFIYVTLLVNLMVLVWDWGVLVITPGELTVPTRLHPGVRTGADRFEKRLFLRVDGVGAVTDIQYGELRTPGAVELGVSGENGAKFFDLNRNVNASLSFAVPRPDDFRVFSEIVKASSTNPLLFFRQPGAAATYASLVAASGKEVWRTPYVVTASSFADLKADAPPEFVFAGPDYAVEARNLSGDVLWRTAPGHTKFGIAIVEGGKPTILVNESGLLVGFGPSGKRLFQRKPAGVSFLAGFYPIRWQGVCPSTCLLVSQNDGFVLLTPDGTSVIAKLRGEYIANVRAAAVRLFDGGSPLLAVAGLLTYKGGRSVGFQAIYGELYLYDSSGNVLYDEIFPEPVEALGVLPIEGGKEALLVGGEDKVWKYVGK